MGAIRRVSIFSNKSTHQVALSLESGSVKIRTEDPIGRMVVDLDRLSLKTDPMLNFILHDGDTVHIPKRPNSISVVGEVLYSSTLGFDPSLGVDEYINLSGGLKDSADSERIFVILPNGRSSLVRKSFFSSSNILIPGSTIVVSRDPRPFDAINLTLGLPFVRVSPDHGPNEEMLGKNLSNPLSLTQSIKFLDKK